MSRAVMQQALEALEKVKTDADKQPPVYPWDIWRMWVDRAITNLRAALAEPQTTHWEGCEAVHPECRKPEPVAWIFVDDTGMKFVSVDRPHKDFQPLYTSAPNPRKPLSPAEVRGLMESAGYESAPAEEAAAFIAGIRYAESAHGITGETK